MKINKLNSLVELYFSKCNEIDDNKSFLKWLKPGKPTYSWGGVLKKEYLNLKKQFNVNWKAAAVAHNRSIENDDSDSKVSLNQLANRCERQIKIVNRKFSS